MCPIHPPILTGDPEEDGGRRTTTTDGESESEYTTREKGSYSSNRVRDVHETKCDSKHLFLFLSRVFTVNTQEHVSPVFFRKVVKFFYQST